MDFDPQVLSGHEEQRGHGGGAPQAGHLLAVPGVVDLYKSINEQIGGLGDTLQEALANA